MASNIPQVAALQKQVASLKRKLTAQYRKEQDIFKHSEKISAQKTDIKGLESSASKARKSLTNSTDANEQKRLTAQIKKLNESIGDSENSLKDLYEVLQDKQKKLKKSVENVKTQNDDIQKFIDLNANVLGENETEVESILTKMKGGSSKLSPTAMEQANAPDSPNAYKNRLDLENKKAAALNKQSLDLKSKTNKARADQIKNDRAAFEKLVATNNARKAALSSSGFDVSNIKTQYTSEEIHEESKLAGRTQREIRGITDRRDALSTGKYDYGNPPGNVYKKQSAMRESLRGGGFVNMMRRDAPTDMSDINRMRYDSALTDYKQKSYDYRDDLKVKQSGMASKALRLTGRKIGGMVPGSGMFGSMFKGGVGLGRDWMESRSAAKSSGEDFSTGGFLWDKLKSGTTRKLDKYLGVSSEDVADKGDALNAASDRLMDLNPKAAMQNPELLERKRERLMGSDMYKRQSDMGLINNTTNLGGNNSSTSTTVNGRPVVQSNVPIGTSIPGIEGQDAEQELEGTIFLLTSIDDTTKAILELMQDGYKGMVGGGTGGDPSSAAPAAAAAAAVGGTTLWEKAKNLYIAAKVGKGAIRAGLKTGVKGLGKLAKGGAILGGVTGAFTGGSRALDETDMSKSVNERSGEIGARTGTASLLSAGTLGGYGLLPDSMKSRIEKASVSKFNPLYGSGVIGGGLGGYYADKMESVKDFFRKDGGLEKPYKLSSEQIGQIESREGKKNQDTNSLINSAKSLMPITGPNSKEWDKKTSMLDPEYNKLKKLYDSGYKDTLITSSQAGTGMVDEESHNANISKSHQAGYKIDFRANNLTDKKRKEQERFLKSQSGKASKVYSHGQGANFHQDVTYKNKQDVEDIYTVSQLKGGALGAEITPETQRKRMEFFSRMESDRSDSKMVQIQELNREIKAEEKKKLSESTRTQPPIVISGNNTQAPQVIQSAEGDTWVDRFKIHGQPMLTAWNYHV